jgi:hypothetical protein
MADALVRVRWAEGHDESFVNCETVVATQREEIVRVTNTEFVD